MKREQEAEFLKDEIYRIQQSKKDVNSENRIVTAHVNADLFIEMAYCFIAKYGK